MGDQAERQARLRALREAAAAEAEGPGDDAPQAVGGPGEEAGGAPQDLVLKFRNYALKADERIQHERVAPAQVPDFDEVKVDVDAALGDDPEEVLVSVAPKKANWDLRRDIADKLARLERRTQGAMIKLIQQESQRREAGAE